VPYYADLNPKGTVFDEAEWGEDEDGRLRPIQRLPALRAALQTAEGSPPPRTLGNRQ
jgi:hypothetical protein